jgi:hypothetical protein
MPCVCMYMCMHVLCEAMREFRDADAMITHICISLCTRTCMRATYPVSGLRDCGGYMHTHICINMYIHTYMHTTFSAQCVTAPELWRMDIGYFMCVCVCV